MTQTVREVMTASPVTCDAKSPFVEAAEVMHKRDIGDVLVLDKGKPCGIVTDRDIVIRGVAAGMDPKTTPIGKLCSKQLTTISPSDPVSAAIDLMRQKAIRRLPVVENGAVVGVVSLGDLAQDKDPKSVLANISAAPAND